jgi:uncharacterized membrane protein YphA (DoxX/SURF4 family)
MNGYSDLSARILLAVMFFMAGIGKIGAYAGTQGYMLVYRLCTTGATLIKPRTRIIRWVC